MGNSLTSERKKEIESGKPLQTHSVLLVDLPKGEYVGIWNDVNVSAFDSHEKLLCSFGVHDKSPISVVKCIIYNYPQTGAIVHAIVE